jgi:ribulose-5-phosphate 4-epimerase/fuculose-1-phosphate aldolase
MEASGQTEIGVLDCVAYDEEYTGLAFDPAEGERLAAVLGPHNKGLFMANHGVLVVGEAYDRLYYLERACQVRLYAIRTGRALKHVPAATVERTRHQCRLASLPGQAGLRTPLRRAEATAGPPRT